MLRVRGQAQDGQCRLQGKAFLQILLHRGQPQQMRQVWRGHYGRRLHVSQQVLARHVFRMRPLRGDFQVGNVD